MKIKKTTLYILGIILLVGVAWYFMADNSSGNIDNNPGNGIGNGEVQDVVIGMKDYNYYPNTIKVKQGQPVRISLDESVYGCFRSFTIRDFGVNKYLRTPEEYVEFTPNKKGTFRFACSMGMGTGTLIVE